jgi:NAD(P)-dependent dehydrogenase (short-subunit alcohol dehydrogenase family)
MAGLLEGKVAIVTGGTSGIGLATVQRYVAEGAKVVVADIQDQLGADLEAAHRGEVAYLHTDVTDEAAIEAVVAGTVERFGKLDAIFNNAGAGGDPAGIIDLTAEGFDKTLALLARSVMLGHKYAARQFQAQGTGGSIVSTASAAGLQGGWSAAGYTTAKHAVVGIVRQAAAELGPLGIRSNAIAPGIIMTPIMARAFGVPLEQAAEFEDFLGERLASSQPIGRVGRPDDIAKVATFLASDLSEFMTGVTVPVDGGATSVNQGGFAAAAAAAGEEFLAR